MAKPNEDNGTHEYSCVILYYDIPEINELHSEIDEEDVYTDDSDRSFGLESEPHTTLLYGLHDNEVNPDDVKNICKKYKYPPLKLHNVSAFKNDKYDVLKFDVKCPVLHDVNKELTSLPHTTDYPEYHPHSTIGYLKPGKADKYISRFKDKEYTVYPKYIVYSRANSEKLYYPL